jgi:hypothetical protein
MLSTLRRGRYVTRAPVSARLSGAIKGLPSVLPFLVFLLATLYTPRDLDLGWHLAYGQYLVQHHRILDTNIYSTTMQGYHWVSSSWLLDALTYALFQRCGFVGLSILGALVSTGMFYVISRAFKLDLIENVIAMLFLYAYLSPAFEASIKGQTVSLLLLSILLLIMKRYEEGNDKILLLSIPLFIIWPNLHTQYFLGLALMVGWFGLHGVRKISSRGVILRSLADLKRIPGQVRTDMKNSNALFVIGVIALTVLATFINPRGVEVLGEIGRHVNNPSQKAIVEWLPFASGSTLWRQFLGLDLFILAICVWLLYKREAIKYLPWMGITLMLMIAAWGTRRYAWSGVIAASFFVLPVIRRLNVAKYQAAKAIAVVVLALWFVWVVKVKLTKEDVSGMDWQRFCRETVECSDASAKFILDNKLTANLWTYYGYGGWLIWNYPEIKPSIDGRMTSWVDEHDYSAFLEYYYQEQGVTDIDKSPYDAAYTVVSKPVYKRLTALAQQKKWTLVYEDHVAAVFIRNKGP